MMRVTDGEKRLALAAAHHQIRQAAFDAINKFNECCAHRGFKVRLLDTVAVAIVVESNAKPEWNDADVYRAAGMGVKL